MAYATEGSGDSKLGTTGVRFSLARKPDGVYQVWYMSRAFWL